MPTPRHAAPRPPNQRPPAAVLAAAVIVAAALVAAVTIHTVADQPGAPSDTSQPTAASQLTSAGSSATSTSMAQPAVYVTGRKRVTAHAGTVTVRTTLWLHGLRRVAVRVPRHGDGRGLSQLRVERVTGPQMHPFSGNVALRKGTELRLIASYAWHGCPRRVPRAWPQPFVLPAHVHLRWQRVDVPRHPRQALCH